MSKLYSNPMISVSRNNKFWKQSEVKVTQSYPTLCDPIDCIVHGILQARILE